MTAPLRRAVLVVALVLATVALGTVVLRDPGPSSDPASPADPSGPSAPEGDLRRPTDADRTGWTATWGAAPTRASEDGYATGFTDTTLRQVVHVSVGGDLLRVRVANTFGDSPLEVGAAAVALGTAGSPDLRRGSRRAVGFDGRTSTVVPAGAEVVSDPVRLVVPAGADVVVDLYLSGTTGPPTWHPAGLATSYSAPTDVTGAPGEAFDARDTSRYFLSGLDVATRRGPDGGAPGAVVFLGDSLTDGVDSGADDDLRLPDQVADRLARRGGRSCGVVNAGISGNRLLSDAGEGGEPAPTRFDRDVLARPGVRTVVVLLGTNDLGVGGGEVAASDLVAAQRQLVARARDAGLRVVGATLPPFGGSRYASAGGEDARRALNRWIRRSGAYDGVVDADRALRDPRRPDRMLPRLDSGDHLHPNAAGYARVAGAVDLDAIC